MVKIILAVFISSATLAGLLSDPPAGRAGFKAEWVGYYCGIKKEERHVIRDEASWRRLWKRMGISAPSVDFRSAMALAVFMGEKRTGGYSVRILGYSVGKKGILVWYRETIPPRDAMVTLALTQPHHIVLIEKSPLPVRFKKVR